VRSFCGRKGPRFLRQLRSSVCDVLLWNLLQFLTKNFVCQVRIQEKSAQRQTYFPTACLNVCPLFRHFLTDLGRNLAQIMYTDCAWRRIYEFREKQWKAYVTIVVIEYLLVFPAFSSNMDRIWPVPMAARTKACGSVASRLRVRIPSETWMSVCCEYCVLVR